MKRRDLLIGLAAAPLWLSGCGGGSAGTTATGTQSSAPPVVTAPVEPEPLPPEILSRASHFHPMAGEVFYIEHPFYGSVDAVLQPLTSHDYDPVLEQFSLSFELPAGTGLSEGTYRVAHRDGAAFDLYLQPSQLDTDGVDRYTAVFSHLAD